MTASCEPTLILAFFGLPGGPEWFILLILGLLIFGRRLPEIGRSMGRSIVEFKRGIKGIGDEIEEESSRAAPQQITDDSAREELSQSTATQKSDSVAAAETNAEDH